MRLSKDSNFSLKKITPLLAILLLSVCVFGMQRSEAKERTPLALSFSISDKVTEQARKYLPHFFNEFQKHIEDINHQLPEEVLTPASVHVVIRYESGASQLRATDENNAEIELLIPPSFLELDQKEFTRHMTAIALHEYGHSLFANTLSANSELFRKNINIAKSQSMPAGDEKNRALVDTLFVKGYDETFADFIAVLFTDNLNAVYDAHIASKEKLRDAEIRSFSMIHNVTGWEYMGPYGLLSPTRSYLGQTISEQMGNKSKGELVAALLPILLKSIDTERELMLKDYKPQMEV